MDDDLEKSLDKFQVKISINDANEVSINFNDETTVVPKFNVKQKQFLNKSVIIFGGSGSGKTTTVRYILNNIGMDIPIIFCFCPTNDDNNMYTNIVPKPCIFTDIKYEQVIKIWEFQNKRKKIYALVNDVTNLQNLCKKIGITMNTDYYKNTIHKYETLKRLILNSKSTKKDRLLEVLDEKLNKCRIDYLKMIIKHYLSDSENRGRLIKSNVLSDADKILINNLDLNPNIMIIFDDCTSELEAVIKQSKKEKDPNKANVIGNLFTKGRHKSITTILASHDPSGLSTQIRNSAHFTIINSKGLALRILVNDFKNDKTAGAIIKTLFDESLSPNKYARPMYSSMETKWYYIISEQVDITRLKIGSSFIRKYCEKIESASRNSIKIEELL